MTQLKDNHRRQPRIALIATYPPVKCGIATFTAHVHDALCATRDDAEVPIVAVDDEDERPPYGEEVMYRIAKNDRASYLHAAHLLNTSDVDVVCIQHEFGIFGGPQGAWILDLIRALRKPVVTVFHTVQARPQEQYRRTLASIAAASDEVVVITNFAITLLRDVYGVPTSRVRVIPHGVPDVRFSDPDVHKAPLGLDGRRVLMTFGLLGPSKGIEFAIDALPSVVERHPETTYVVVGATHPGVIRYHGGDTYRQMLLERVRERGLEHHVQFHDRYLEESELVDYLRACDIYVSPYPGADQISSGTLSYAVGLGLAVVSTPYIYARELLARDRGVLVDFASADSMAGAINELIENPGEWERVRRTAWTHGRRMTWANVGRAYHAMFDQLASRESDRAVTVRQNASGRPRPATATGRTTVAKQSLARRRAGIILTTIDARSSDHTRTASFTPPWGRTNAAVVLSLGTATPLRREVIDNS